MTAHRGTLDGSPYDSITNPTFKQEWKDAQGPSGLEGLGNWRIFRSRQAGNVRAGRHAAALGQRLDWPSDRCRSHGRLPIVSQFSAAQANRRQQPRPATRWISIELVWPGAASLVPLTITIVSPGPASPWATTSASTHASIPASSPGRSARCG